MQHDISPFSQNCLYNVVHGREINRKRKKKYPPKNGNWYLFPFRKGAYAADNGLRAIINTLCRVQWYRTMCQPAKRFQGFFSFSHILLLCLHSFDESNQYSWNDDRSMLPIIREIITIIAQTVDAGKLSFFPPFGIKLVSNWADAIILQKTHLHTMLCCVNMWSVWTGSTSNGNDIVLIVDESGRIST